MAKQMTYEVAEGVICSLRANAHQEFDHAGYKVVLTLTTQGDMYRLVWEVWKGSTLKGGGLEVASSVWTLASDLKRVVNNCLD